MRRLVLTVILAIFSLPTVAQGGPELDALMDAIFAKDLKALAPHLPPELNKAIEEASPVTRQRFSQVLLLSRMIEREGGKIVRPDSGPVLRIERVHPELQSEHADPLELYLDKRMTDGNETMLRFRAKEKQEYESGRRSYVTIWMRYVDGEWRVYTFEDEGEETHLDDPKFIAMFSDSSKGVPAEASAVGSMRTLNTANITYASTYPDRGFPDRLAVLGGDGGTSDHAGLIDEVLASGVKSGYRFNYQVSGDHMSYTIIARPVEGSGRSFFTDQSGVIRFTTEDREPTVEDAPLQ